MNRQNILATISLIFSIFALTVAFVSKDVLINVYEDFTQAKTSAKQGFADRWTKTNHLEYAARVQRKIDHLQNEIDALKRQQ